MKIGFARGSERCPFEEQEEILLRWGAKKIFTNLTDFIGCLRGGSIAGVVWPHRLGATWDEMVGALKEIEAKGVKLRNARTSRPITLGEISEARGFYAGEKRMPSSEEARRRAALSVKARRALLNGHKMAARKIWLDAEKHDTNDESAAAISALIGANISIPTLWRVFGPSGRPRGKRKSL